MNGKTVIFGVVCMYIGFRMGVKTTCDRVLSFLEEDKKRIEKARADLKAAQDLRDKHRPDYKIMPAYAPYNPFPGEEINKK